jgi:hypothetical protein
VFLTFIAAQMAVRAIARRRALTRSSVPTIATAGLMRRLRTDERARRR